MTTKSKKTRRQVLITGDELAELKKFTVYFAECTGLERRLANYKGKRPLGLDQWDLRCLTSIITLLLHSPNHYPNPKAPECKLMQQLLARLEDEYRSFDWSPPSTRHLRYR